MNLFYYVYNNRAGTCWSESGRQGSSGWHHSNPLSTPTDLKTHSWPLYMGHGCGGGDHAEDEDACLYR